MFVFNNRRCYFLPVSSCDGDKNFMFSGGDKVTYGDNFPLKKSVFKVLDIPPKQFTDFRGGVSDTGYAGMLVSCFRPVYP